MVIHANTASVGKLHANAAKAIRRASIELERSDFYTNRYSDLNRSFDIVRTQISNLMRVPTSQISLQTSTSSGLAKLLASIPSNHRGVIAYPSLAFASTQGLALHLRGSVFVPVGDPLGRITRFDLDSLGVKPRIVIAEWINWVSGAETNLVEIASWCRKHGALLFVDGVQGFGVKRLENLPEGIDAFISGFQKWCLAPEGSAFAYVSPNLIDIGRPQLLGYQSLLDFQTDHSLRNDARKFETGTLSLPSFVGAAAALETLDQAEVARRELSLTNLISQILVQIQSIDRSKIHFDSRGTSGILSFNIDSIPPETTLRLLGKAGVNAQMRQGWVRLSPCPFTDPDALIKSLNRFKNLLRTIEGTKKC